MAPLTEIAPAKINLGLRITGRRSDGYHLIDSYFAFSQAGDTLTLKPGDDLTLTVSGRFASELEGAGPIKDNLVLKAARMVKEKAGVAAGAAIHLEKNLPLAAGIGGGSSDAAAALRGLMRLWQVSLSKPDLENMALSLGADVPACLTQAPKHVAGIGERMTPVEAGGTLPILLFNPLKKLSTPAVFQQYRALGAPFGVPMIDGDGEKTLENLLRNDLQAPAFDLLPELADFLASMKRLSGVRAAAMSGSGATLYALFEKDAAALKAREFLEKTHPNTWIYLDRLTPPKAVSALIAAAS